MSFDDDQNSKLGKILQVLRDRSQSPAAPSPAHHPACRPIPVELVTGAEG